MIGVVLYFYPKNESNYRIWALREINGRRILEYFFDRVSRVLPPQELSLCIAGHDAVLEQRIAAKALPPQVHLHVSKHKKRIALLHDLAIAMSLDSMMIFPEGSIFPGIEAAREMMALHQANAADLTFSEDSPVGFAPQIVSTEALRRLAELDVPAPSDLGLLTLMKRVNAVAPPEAPEFRIQSFSVDDLYGSDTIRLPARLLVRDEATFKAACNVLMVDSPREGTLEEAFRFKRFILDETAVVAYECRSSHSRRRVLYCSLAGSFSGAEESFCQLVMNLDRRRYEPVVVLTSEGFLYERLSRAGVRADLVEEELSSFSPGSLAYFDSLLERERIDIVHEDSVPIAPLLAAAYYHRIPVVTHVRVFNGRNLPSSFGFSAKIVAISEAIRTDILKNDIHPLKVEVVHNGVDLREFDRRNSDATHLRRDLGVSASDFVITFVARICRQKRQQFVVDVMAKLCSDHPEALLLIVGEVYGNEVDYMIALRDQIARLGLEARVRFTGFVKDMESIYAMSDAAVLCTVQEPFGRTIIEAMAMEVPVIVPDRAGPAEIVVHGESGLTYDPLDSKQLLQALTRVMTDGHLRQRLQAGGLQRAQELSIQTHASKMQHLYDRLLIGATDAGEGQCCVQALGIDASARRRLLISAHNREP